VGLLTILTGSITPRALQTLCKPAALCHLSVRLLLLLLCVCMQGILPYAGLKFYVYQAMKNSYRTWQIDQQKQQQQQQQQREQVQQQQQEEEEPEHPHLAPAPPFETALQQAQVAEAEEEEQQQRPQKLPIAVTLVFGGVAGLVAQTVTYPLVSNSSSSSSRCWICSVLLACFHAVLCYDACCV